MPRGKGRQTFRAGSRNSHRPSHGARGGSAQASDIYVKRKLWFPQPELADFVTRFGNYMGAGAEIHAPASPNLTYARLRSSRDQLLGRPCSQEERDAFMEQLRRRLSGYAAKLTVDLDPQRPLELVPVGNETRLAFNVKPSDKTTGEHAVIKQVVEGEFGRQPGLDVMEHTVVFASLRTLVSPDERADPRLLLPAGLEVPTQLNLASLVAPTGHAYSNGIRW